MRSRTRWLQSPAIPALMAFAALGCRASGVPAAHNGVATLPGRPDCSSCRIVLQRVSTVGRDSLDGFLPRYPIWVSMDARKRVYVTVQPPEDLVLTYDSAGRFIGRIGRKGRGPGEFEWPIVALPTADDHLLVYDFGTAQLTTLTSSWRYVGRHFQPKAPIAVFADGRTVASYPSQDSRGIGYGLSLYGDSGRQQFSFAASAQPMDRDEMWRLTRMVAPASGDRLWAASEDRYRIEQWTLEPRLVGALERHVDWFPVTAEQHDGVRGVRPTPRIMSVHQDGQQRLWVYTRVPAEHWQEGLGPVTRTPGRPDYYAKRDEGRLFDTMVDVIDLRSQRLLLSERVRAHIMFALRDEYVAAYREEDGAPLLDIWRIRAVGLSPQ